VVWLQALFLFLDTGINSGIDMLISASGISNSIAGADLLITGEGRFDSQTLHGKLVSAIAGLAKQYEVPVIVFCGISDADDAVLEKLTIRSVQTIVSESVSQEAAIANAGSLLTERVYHYFITKAGNPSPGL
jgi:glycerate kinase